MFRVVVFFRFFVIRFLLFSLLLVFLSRAGECEASVESDNEIFILAHFPSIVFFFILSCFKIINNRLAKEGREPKQNQ